MDSNQPNAGTEMLEVAVPRGGDGDRQVRLSLSLVPAVADVLKGYARRRGITITEAVRRAASLLAFADDIDERADATIAVMRKGVVQPVRFNWDD